MHAPVASLASDQSDSSALSGVLAASFLFSFSFVPFLLGERDLSWGPRGPRDTEVPERRAAEGVPAGPYDQPSRDLSSLDGRQGGGLGGTDEEPEVMAGDSSFGG